MKTSKAKPSPANIVDVIRRELESQTWEWETLMAAAQALGIAKAKERYTQSEFLNARSELIREALEMFGTSKAIRKPGKRVAWRRTLFELWQDGALEAEKAGEIVREHIARLSEKVTIPPPKARIKQVLPRQRQPLASDGDLSGKHFTLEHETVVGIAKAMQWMNNRSDNFIAGESLSGPRVNRLVNEMIRAAADAVMNFVPAWPLGFREPFVLEARAETEEERETRLMLESLSK